MIPDEWQRIELGKIVTFKSGGTPSKQKPEYWDGAYPWISAKDLKSHFLRESKLTLSGQGWIKAKTTPAGSVLVLVRGMTLLKDFPIGITEKETAFNQDIKALVPKDGINALFLSYLLVANKKRIRKLVSTAGHGTGRIDTNQLKAYPLLIPNEKEQKKIARILSTWDKAIETVEKLIENSKAQKKALTQQLLTGKRRLPEFEGKWLRVKLSELTEITYGKSPKEILCDEGRFPVIGTGGVVGRTNTALYDGPSVIIGRKGTINNPLYIAGSFWAIDTTFYCVPKSTCDINWLYYTFISINLKNYNEASGVPSLSRGTLYSIRTFTPPIKEQQRIALILATTDKEIETLQQKLDCLKQEKKALMQQLLTGKRRVKVDADG